jgi:hypothetical protein
MPRDREEMIKRREPWNMNRIEYWALDFDGKEREEELPQRDLSPSSEVHFNCGRETHPLHDSTLFFAMVCIFRHLHKQVAS